MSGFIPWEARDGWTDVKPVAQAEAPSPLVPINYSQEYVSAVSTFRCIQTQNELSRRVLDLTSAIVQMNPAHYTVWAYRSKTLLHLKESEEDGQQLLVKELGILDDLVKVHLKNYQVWQHRRIIVVALDDSSRELPFTTRALALDAKNYHTWAYRQWALSHFFGDSTKHAETWLKELEFTDSLIENDVRNNSAWNHRWFTVFARPEEAGKDIVERELQFAQSKITLTPNNPSVWNYFRGILDRFGISYSSYLQWAQDVRSPADQSEVPLAVEFVADALIGSEDVEKLGSLYDSLATKLDPMRRGYWEWKKSLIGTAIVV